MNAHETLLFVGKCLSLSVHPECTGEIRDEIQTGNINWERVVWIGSSHYVLPALFVQFRNNELLKELPEDLVDYLEEIYHLNLGRNIFIKNEAISITAALNSIGIAPIFLKGTAHILEGLYCDIGERMIGDIDFLLPEEDILPAVNKLKDMGYFDPLNHCEAMQKTFKHFPRLQNEKAVAAVEVHRQVVLSPHSKNFSFEVINNNRKRINSNGDAYVLSDSHQIIHNVLNAQLNDNAYKQKSILLRNIYDLLLLAKRENTIKVANNFGHYRKQFNAYFFVASKFLGNTNQITFANNLKARRYYSQLLFLSRNTRLYYINKVIHNFISRIVRYIKLLLISLVDKTERRALIWRLTTPKWYVSHLKSLHNLVK
nr:nucleotidyltransferase family protein [uncultured Draconibacterium sp.]